MTIEKKGSWQANPAILAAQIPRPNINYDETKVPTYTVPDVLSDGNGGKITTIEGWRKRRAELLDLFRHEEYGYSPAVPQDMWFETVKCDKAALDGDATLKLVDIHLGRKPNAPIIHLQLFVPNKRTAPAPAFLLMCNRAKTNIDVTRAVKSEFWPVEEMIAKGYAIASFHYEDVALDRKDSFDEGVYPYFLGDGTRKPTDWGALSAWAWASSRCMDYFETDSDIDAKHCVITGHSRGGKTALWCGAQDERWAMTISSCSGCSGAALARRCYGESLEVIQNAFPYWFCENYFKYANHENELPFDQHQLIALIAPRAVYVHSADEDLWADPKGEWTSLHLAEPVWKLYGRKGLPMQEMPALDEPAWGDGMAYHVRPGEHNNKLVDWMRHADFFRMEMEKH